MKTVLHICILLLIAPWLHAQEISYEKTAVEVPLLLKVHPSDVKYDWLPKLTHVSMPFPGSSLYGMKQIKKQSAAKFPRQENGIQSWTPNGSPPNIGMSFPIAKTIILPNDTLIQHIAGGTPNDNTLAISDSGIVLSSFNSQVYAYDTNKDTAIMLMGLHSFSTEFTNNSKFDPKVIYDPIEDRFILVFLNGSSSNKSQIIVSFSTTSDPLAPWNLYALSGNPFNDSTWLDYPAVSVTSDELFITGNQINDNGPWQTAFDQSIIWQLNKKNGYDGDSTLTTTLWSDIKTDGRNIRNLHLVQGGSWPTGPSQYLLSNRNFDVLNDSIFLLEVVGTLADTNTVLNINIGKSVSYGMPPDGRQNHIDSMNTNDARVLGAFIENGEIQYVSVTVDTVTGYAAIYHGFINGLDSTPVFTANILSDDSLDLGYPNIAYSGTHSCSRQSIIGMDHTSPERNPGISALVYNSDNTYSELISLKEAESPVKKNFTIDHERWGDYFGIQRRYNKINNVWTAGFYGRANGNYTWISELTASSETPLAVTAVSVNYVSCKGGGDGSATATVVGGYTPYTFEWDGPDGSTTPNLDNVGASKYSVLVNDSIGCTVSDSIEITEPDSLLILSMLSVKHVSSYGHTDGEATITISGGVSPYQIYWNDKLQQSELTASSLRGGQVTVNVTDSANCNRSASVIIEEPLPRSNIFPNPATDLVQLFFDLEQPGMIDVEIYDSRGALVKTLFSDNAKTGANIFSFSVKPLNQGTYILRIKSGNTEILTKKIVKQ